MKIAEVFTSIQGEGILSGVPSFFIRTTGCNLRCVFCDSPHTSWNPEGRDQSLPQIIDGAIQSGIRHVVLTGGEPLLQHDIAELAACLRAAGLHLTIETAGTLFKELECDLISLSPKLANSTPWERENGKYQQRHDDLRIQPQVLRAFMDRHEYQLKFVVDQPNDLKEIQELLGKLGQVERARVLLMPQGITREELDARSPWVVETCKKEGFRFCPRLQIELYGNQRGT
ncbi:MAG: 7-carboxy-7-deazaguanine synthase QueE [Gemmataceae bacterium]|nr:7-carboxy-7-deazaguanine synthase QueE [Gemmataceae bacterium]